MTKKEMVGKLLEPMVWESFYDTYGLRIGEPTDKQIKFISQISEKLYDLVGKKFTHEELQTLVRTEDDENLS